MALHFFTRLSNSLKAFNHVEEKPLYKAKELLGEWKADQDELKYRHDLLKELRDRIEQNFDKENALTLAATDLFVVQAQKALIDRASFLLGIGAILSFLIIGGLAFGFYYITSENHFKVPNGDSYNFTLTLIRLISANTFALAAAYFLLGLARACLHEGLALFQRRHALRFGKLFIYIKRNNISFDELNTAFKWHEQAETAFRDGRGACKLHRIVQFFGKPALHQLMRGAEFVMLRVLFHFGHEEWMERPAIPVERKEAKGQETTSTSDCNLVRIQPRAEQLDHGRQQRLSCHRN